MMPVERVSSLAFLEAQVSWITWLGKRPAVPSALPETTLGFPWRVPLPQNLTDIRVDNLSVLVSMWNPTAQIWNHLPCWPGSGWCWIAHCHDKFRRGIRRGRRMVRVGAGFWGFGHGWFSPLWGLGWGWPAYWECVVEHCCLPWSEAGTKYLR